MVVGPSLKLTGQVIGLADTLIAKKGYMRVIQYSLGATLYGWFFEKTNLGSTQTAGIVANFFAKLQRAFFGSFYEFLYTFEPDFVINTHFLPADLIGQLQDERGYDVPHVTVVTGGWVKFLSLQYTPSHTLHA